MKTFLLKIKNLIKVFSGFFKINPHKHWGVLIRIFLISILILILFSLYFLYRIKNDQIFQVKVEQSVAKSLLKESLLKSTTEFYDSRENNTEEINSSISIYKDPSI